MCTLMHTKARRTCGGLCYPVQPKRDARVGHRVRAQRAATRLRATASVTLSHTAPQQHVEILAHSGRTSSGLFTLSLALYFPLFTCVALFICGVHSFDFYSLFNPAPAKILSLASDFSFP